MRPLGVPGIFFLTAILEVYVTGEADIDLDCKPKPGCVISKCDPIPIEAGSIFNLEEPLKRSEYPITCEAKKIPLLETLIAIVGGRDSTPGQKGEKGKKGNAGSRGPIGPKGEVGKVGENGKKGATGVAGRDGINGIRGPVGPVGPKGSRGIVGPKGASGPMGRPGIKGERGPPGPPGSAARPSYSRGIGGSGRA